MFCFFSLSLSSRPFDHLNHPSIHPSINQPVSYSLILAVKRKSVIVKRCRSTCTHTHHIHFINRETKVSVHIARSGAALPLARRTSSIHTPRPSDRPPSSRPARTAALVIDVEPLGFWCSSPWSLQAIESVECSPKCFPEKMQDLRAADSQSRPVEGEESLPFSEERRVRFPVVAARGRSCC